MKAQGFKRKYIASKILVETICILFFLLFLYAATSKLLDYPNFKSQLGMSPILTSFSKWLSWFVPGLEIITAIMLTLSKIQLVALYFCFSAMVMFSVYIFIITQYSEYIPCSCGGIFETMSWNGHLFINILLGILALAGIILYQEPAKG